MNAAHCTRFRDEFLDLGDLAARQGQPAVQVSRRRPGSDGHASQYASCEGRLTKPELEEEAVKNQVKMAQVRDSNVQLDPGRLRVELHLKRIFALQFDADLFGNLVGREEPAKDEAREDHNKPFDEQRAKGVNLTPFFGSTRSNPLPGVRIHSV